MTDPDSAGRLTADALQLAITLDSFTTLDWAERIGPAVQLGKHKLTALQQRRASLILTRADGAVIDWVLETIYARLRFVERLDSAMRQPGSKAEPQSEPEQLPHGPREPAQRENRPGTAQDSRPGVLDLYAGDDQAA